MTPLYIFDLDGTLALIDHRRPILADKSNSNRWDDFYRACVDDEPNVQVIFLLRHLICNLGKWREGVHCTSDVYIFSGRSDLVEVQTRQWLAYYCYPVYAALFKMPGFEDSVSRLLMRPHGDSTPDDILKKKWYDELSDHDKQRLVCVFDDRQKVVDMWRSIGVTCLQVARGDF